MPKSYEEEVEKDEAFFERYEKVSNNDLLAEYGQCIKATHECLRNHNVDAHGHYHHQKMLEEVIKSRMCSPDIIKVKIR